MVTGSDAGLQQETKVRRGLLPADISKAAHGFTCPRKRNKSSRRIASSRDDGIVVVAARPRRNESAPSQRQRAPKKTAALRSWLRLKPHQVRCCRRLRKLSTARAVGHA
jgi:hypothetical protein